VEWLQKKGFKRATTGKKKHAQETVANDAKELKLKQERGAGRWKMEEDGVSFQLKFEFE